MQSPNSNPTPESSWRTIHETIDHSRSSMYLAGTSNILLLWGGIIALGYLAQLGISSLASDFADENPWFPAPLWLVLVGIGIVASSIIGHRASQKMAGGDVSRSAGFRVFLFWFAVAAAAFVIPLGAGMWNADAGPIIPGVSIGVISLGYILFGIMVRSELAVIGAAIGAAFFLPYHFAGDAAWLITAILMLAIVICGAVWLRSRGVE